FGLEMLPILQKNGATHLTLKINSLFQGHLNRFMDTGDKQWLEFLNTIEGHHHFSYSALLEKARSVGLNLVAVDEQVNWKNKDTIIADNIATILERDPKAKVVNWTSAFQAMKHSWAPNKFSMKKYTSPTATEQLAQQFSTFSINNLSKDNG